MNHKDEKFPIDEVLETEFVKSWEHVEWFFGAGEIFRKMPHVVEFIEMLRASGYDRKLRAGQSLDLFVVSRSRKHGLRPEQPSIAFHIYEGKVTVFSRGLQAETFVETAAILSGPVQELLDRLSSEAIT